MTERKSGVICKSITISLLPGQVQSSSESINEADYTTNYEIK